MTDELMPLHGNEQTDVPGPLDAIQKAISAGATPETISKMMDLQERWEATEALKEFNAAFAKARGEIEPILKTNPVAFTNARGVETSYKYEDLADIARVVDPILARHGMSYRYSAKTEGMFTEITCHLFHVRGHSEQASLPTGLDTSGGKNSVQSLGSSVTYLKRYTLGLVLGLASEKDDDGRSAPGNGGNKGNITKSIDAAQFQYLTKLMDDITALEQHLLSQDELDDLGTVELRLLDLIHANDLETITQSQFGAAKAGLLQLQRRRQQALEVKTNAPAK